MNKQRNGVIFSYNSLYLRRGMMTCTRPEARSLCLSSPQSLPQVLVLVGKRSVTELHAAAAVGGGNGKAAVSVGVVAACATCCAVCGGAGEAARCGRRLSAAPLSNPCPAAD